MLEGERFWHILNFGTHAHQRFFEENPDDYHGICVPGNVLAYFTKGTSSFLSSINKDYFIDPRTSALKGRVPGAPIAASLRKLAQIHGPTVETALSQDNITPDTFLSSPDCFSEMAEKILAYQRNVVSTTMEESKARKYLALAQLNPQPASPKILVAPYFHYRDERDPWYVVNRELMRSSAQFKDALPLAAMVPLSLRTVLGETGQIVNDLLDDGIDMLLLWVDDFDEHMQSVEALQGVARLADRLVGTLRKPVIKLYGSYFSILLFYVGVRGISNGIGYGERKAATELPGGPAPLRYYVPALHRYLPQTVAETLLLRYPSLTCNCEICASLQNPARITELGHSETYNHFLKTRTAEINHVLATSLNACLDELRNTYEEYARKPGLPDPNHLLNWAEALQVFA